MSKYKNTLFVCLVTFFCQLSAWATAQERQLTLQESLGLGLKNNLQFKISQLKVVRAAKMKRSKASRFLPQIGAGISHNYYFGSTIDPSSNARVSSNIQSDNFSLEAAINLFNFSELWESKLQDDDLLIEKLNKENQEREFMMLLIQQYFDALAAQEWKKVLKQQVLNSEQQLDRIQMEVQDGAKPESDIDDIKLLYTQEQKLLIQTQQDESNQKTILLQLINDSLQSAEELLLTKDLPFYHVQASQSNLHPTIQLEIAKANRIENEYHQLLGNFLPKVSLSYAYGTFYSNTIKDIFDTSLQFGNQLSINKNQFVGINISIPIFNRGDRWRNRLVKKIELREQEEQVNKVKLDFQNKLDLEKKKHQQFMELQIILDNQVQLAKSSFETAQSKFEFGRVDISALILAKNQVLNAEYEKLKNKLSADMTHEIIATMLR